MENQESREIPRLLQKTFDGEELVNDKKLLGDLASVYAEIFNAKGEYEWGENWKVQEAIQLLESSLTQRESKNIITLLMDEKKDQPIVGFSMGHIGKARHVIQPSQMPKDLEQDKKESATKEISDRLSVITKNDILYVQDLGILKSYRTGSKRVADLTKPLFSSALERNSGLSTYWTSKKSKLYFLTKILEPEEIFRFHDEQENIFMSGSTLKIINILDMNENEINNLLRKKYD